MTHAVTYRWPADIGHLVDGERVIVALLPDGIPKALAGSGAAIWLYADGATLEQITARLGAAYGVAPAELAEAVAAFCAELVAYGFLVTG